jgi:hypothetical protein
MSNKITGEPEISPAEFQFLLDTAVEHTREERANPTYDESTNPSNGWRHPDSEIYGG